MTFERPTRPCKPGDVLVKGSEPCGVYWEIGVEPPTPHPASGVSETAEVCLEANFCIPVSPENVRYIRNDLVDITKNAVGEVLRETWGEGEWSMISLKYPTTHRCRCWRNYGTNIPAMVDEMLQICREAGATVQAVFDAHEASVTRVKEARQLIYSQWPVCEQSEPG